MTKIKKEIKKANINAHSDFDYFLLTKESPYLLRCNINHETDKVLFEFYLQGEKEFENLKKTSLLFKYQALRNIQYLYIEAQRLQISLEPNNVYYDFNKMPKIMLRDVYLEKEVDEEDFVQQYKALVGYLLQNKYSYKEYYEGGNQLLSKNKLTEDFTQLNTIDEIGEILETKYNELLNKLENKMVILDKNKYKHLNAMHRISVGLLVISIVVGGYFGFFKLRQEKVFNDAYEAYVVQDYVSVMESLKETPLKRMNKKTKYILAVSNIKAETLNDEQKNNILSSVSIKSDTRILDFWIYLGQSDMEKAIDIAKQLGNKEYIAYGYMKEKSKVEKDSSLSGEEREKKLKDIEESLNKLGLQDDNE